MVTEWQGDTPVFIVIFDDENHVVQIDVDESGWLTTYAAWLRVPGWWELRSKDDNIVRLRVRVWAGDQPYYAARHVGITGSGGSNEVTAYGIGKKLPAIVDDNHVVVRPEQMTRVWLMPDGSVCGGDDVDDLGIAMVRQLGPK